jgi:PAS domain S-box-containing protein
MKIRTQLIAGMIVFGVLIICIAILFINTNLQAEELDRQEQVANEIALQVGELGYLSNDYILYREPQQAERWETKYSSISDLVSSLPAVSPEEQAIAGNLAANLRNTRAVFDDIRSSPAPAEDTAGFVQLSWSRMAVQNQGMIFNAGRLAHLLGDQADEMRQARTLLILALSGAFVAFLFTSYTLFFRRALHSIADLQEGARIVGSGDLGYKILEKGDDEITDLSRSFNRMTANLKTVIASKTELEREIAEREKADKARRKSEERYQTLFENMSEGFFINEVIFNSEGKPSDFRFLKVNPAFERQTGLKAEDVIGRTAFQLFPEADPARLEIFENILLSREPVHFEEKFDPLGRWFAVSAYLTEQDRIAVVFSDITERKKAEDALRESEERFKSFYENAPVGFAFLDPHFRYRYINQRLAEMNGYSVTDHINRTVEEMVPGLWQSAKPAFEQVRDTRLPIPAFEIHGETGAFPGITRFWLESLYPVVMPDGRFIGIGVMILDITERKEAELALRESRERLNEALDLLDAVTKGTDVIIAAQDPSFRYTYFNRAYADVIRRLTRKDIVVGMSLFEVFDGLPDELENSVKEWGRVLGGESVNRRVNFGEPGLSRRTYHVLHTPIRDFTGSVVGAGEVAYDVTEQARMEDELRETRNYLENLITFANAPIIVWDPELRITRFNRAFEYLTGRKAEEVMGKSLDLLFPDETRGESLEKIYQTLKGERWETTEIPVLHRDGSVKTVIWNSATIFDEETGVPVSTIAQGQDITERKAAEEALKQYAINLKRSNEDLERFAYVSSHDLQEPLRNVVIFTQLLEQKYGGQMGEEADEYLRFVVDAGKRMQSLISDLLAYSRVTTKESRMVRTESEAVLQETLAALKPRIDRCNVRLTVDPLPPVVADATQLGQVFQNLITNAIKFRKQDVMPEIHISARRLDGMVLFSVQDNGIGIDPEYFDKIFVIFQRLHGYEAYEGTGIGLALCKRIIERHGGRIWVESGVGKGSTFFFTLPAAD